MLSTQAYFGCEAFWGSKPEWHRDSRRYATVGRHCSEAAVPEGECGPCPVFALYPGIRLATEEESRKSLSQGSQRVPDRTAQGTIRLVVLAAILPAADLHHHCLVLQVYSRADTQVPICRTKVFLPLGKGKGSQLQA